MGEVFLAQDTKLNCTVALRFLPSQYSPEEESRARFKREPQAAADPRSRLGDGRCEIASFHHIDGTHAYVY